MLCFTDGSRVLLLPRSTRMTRLSLAALHFCPRALVPQAPFCSEPDCTVHRSRVRATCNRQHPTKGLHGRRRMMRPKYVSDARAEAAGQRMQESYCFEATASLSSCMLNHVQYRVSLGPLGQQGRAGLWRSRPAGSRGHGVHFTGAALGPLDFSATQKSPRRPTV